MNTDLNFKHLRAITLFQDLYRDKKRALSRLNSKMEVVYNTLLSVTNNLSINYVNQVLTQDIYHQFMSKINDILRSYENIPYPIPLREMTYRMKLDIGVLEYQTIDLVKQCGANSIYDILRIMIGADWDLELSTKGHRLLAFYNTMFVPKMVRVSNGSGDCKALMPEVKKYSTYATSIVINLHGAEIDIPVYNKILTVKGYFKDDPLNISRIGGTIGSKYHQLYEALSGTGDIINKTLDLEYIERDVPENIRKISDVDNTFKHRFVDQISLRDFLCNTVDQLCQSIIEGYQELLRLKSKTLSQLSDTFSKSKIKYQTHVLTLLLLDENSHTMVRSLIAMLSSRNSEEMTSIYRLLHWHVQNIFDSVTNDIERTIDPARNEEEIPYDIRIENMKCSEAIKRKARDKLKEIKTSRDGNDKAQKYLDAILRIPFGIYRKEPILRFIGEFRDELRKLISQLKDYKVSDNRSCIDPIIHEMINKLTMRRIDTANDIDKCVSEIAKYLSYLINMKKDMPEPDATDFLLSSSPSTHINGLLEPDEHLLEFRNRIIRTHRNWEQFKIERKTYMKTITEKLEDCLYKQTDAKHKLSSLVAQWINGEMSGAVFGFCGYPGTGKTTLAKHGLANCLLDEAGNPRPICFIPLGGATNSSTLDGHNFTYVGSRWGKIADCLMEVKISNPILYFDELDKVSETPHGNEIIHFLTHLTDPEQNDQIMDKYFNIDLDLSKAVIVFSYNNSDKIDEILMQRITEIPFTQYNAQEKTHIGVFYILPKILKTVGYTDEEIIFKQEQVEYVASIYTHEAGVRELKEKLMEIVREINIRHITDEEHFPLPFTVTDTLIDDILKRKNKIILTKIPPTPQIGWVNGLYATSLGTGGLTVIQVFDTLSENKFSIELTGKLGDVMKESVRCAKTIGWKILPASVKKRIDDEWKDHPYGLHIHFPAAGTSKDGPSAGAAITTAIVSFFCRMPFRNYIAMTGEIDLYGNIRAIGGLQSKIEGAIRAGVKIVLIPKENECDWLDIQNDYQYDIKVFAVENISQIIETCLINTEKLEFEHIHEVDNDALVLEIKNALLPAL